MGLRCALPRLSFAALPLLLIVLSGCGSSPSSNSGGNTGSNSGTTGPLVSGGAASVYAIQNAGLNGNSYVLQFVAGANGAVSPTNTLTLPTGFSADGVAVDSSGQIYVCGLGVTQSQILVYPVGSSSPTRTINTPSNGAITVDSAGLVYLAGNASVSVYSSTANGSAIPIRVITAPATQLATGYPENLSVDSTGSLYVATTNTAETSGNVLVFPPNANGNTNPTRTISLSNVPFGAVADSAGNIYVSENSATGTPPAFIAEFSAGSTTPAKTITLSSTASQIGGLEVDSVGNIYAIMYTGTVPSTTGTFSVIALGPTSTGTISPTKQMTSTALSAGYTQIAIR